LRILEQKWHEREKKIEAADDLHAEVRKMEIEIKTQKNFADNVRPFLEQKEVEISVFRETLAAEESIKMNQLNDLQRSLNQTSGLMSDIQSFIDQDGAKRLEDCIQEISNLGSEIKAAKLSLEEIASKIDKMNKQRSEIQVLQRTIDDNLKYRKMIAERESLDSKLNALNLLISEFDTESIEMQYNKLKQVHAKLVGERAVSFLYLYSGSCWGIKAATRTGKEN
jgi:chromosome segregation ATPase